MQPCLKGKGHEGPFYELDLSEWDKVMTVNVKGTLLCSRAVFPPMKAQGGGKIINVSSAACFFGKPQLCPLCRE